MDFGQYGFVAAAVAGGVGAGLVVWFAQGAVCKEVDEKPATLPVLIGLGVAGGIVFYNMANKGNQQGL